jgi:hypothetical protein
MTVRQLYLFGCLYLVMLIATAVFTRATLRRIAGALAGAAVFGPAALGIVPNARSNRSNCPSIFPNN